MTNSWIGGDAGEKMTNSTGGDGDLIYIQTLESGNVGGDTGGWMEGSIAGADAIHIGTMNGGSLYGDGRDFGGNTAASGSNIITVDTFGDSTTAINIEGGFGTIANGNADILSFGSGVDAVTLSGNVAGSMTATFGADDGNARTGSINISKTEVFDGGSGNDSIDASGVTGNIVLRGGTGDDTLTGNGSTTFHWSAKDITEGAVDTVNFKAGDTLLVGDGVTEELNGNVLNLTANGVTQTVNISGTVDTSALQSVVAGTASINNVTLSNNIDAALEMAANLESLVQG